MTPLETLVLASYFFILIVLAAYGWHRYYLVYSYMKNKDRVPVPAGRFEELPPLLVNTLLFLENRELLDPFDPRSNPVIEWDRLAKAGRSRNLSLLPESGRISPERRRFGTINQNPAPLFAGENPGPSHPLRSSLSEQGRHRA